MNAASIHREAILATASGIVVAIALVGRRRG